MTTEFDEESGSTLRAKLEEALGKNRKLEERLSRFIAHEVITSKGLDLVEPDDLIGVPEVEIEAKAMELQKQRWAVVEKHFRKTLAAQGLEGEELDRAVEAALGGNPQGEDRKSEDAEVIERFARARELQTAGGSRPPAVNPDKLHGYDAIEAALEAKAAKRNR